jgi:hypothetical protein
MRISSKHVLDHYAIQNHRLSKEGARADSRMSREKMRATAQKAREVFGENPGESFAEILKGIASPRRH